MNTDCEVGQWIDEVGGQSMVAYRLSQIVQKPVYPSMVRGWKLKNEIPANWKVIIRQNFGLNTIPQCLQLSVE